MSSWSEGMAEAYLAGRRGEPCPNAFRGCWRQGDIHRRFKRLHGWEAIKAAEAGKGVLRAYADPTGDDDRPVTVEEAREILREDPSLVYLDP